MTKLRPTLMIPVALAMGVASSIPLLADGGTLRVANVVMGSYRVSVFTDPTPITPDSLDVSVLATFERGREIAQGLEIAVLARLLDGSGREIQHPATRDQAEDPRYYAAKFSPGAVGEWEIVVRVEGPEGSGEASFLVRVQNPGPFDNPFLILGVALLPLALVGWWLRGTPSNEEVSSPSTRPGG
jgi:hypothetical protein